MERDCSFYFLSNTLLQAWRNDDTAILNEMFICVTNIHKENWFRRVIYANAKIAQWRLREIAENAFLYAWVELNEDGKAGKIVFKKVEYTGLLYRIFQRKYRKEFQKQMKEEYGKNEYINRQPKESENLAEDNQLDKIRARQVLLLLGTECSELMQWRYIEGVSYDEIAKRKLIKEESCKQNLFRCKKRFLELWKKAKKQSY